VDDTVNKSDPMKFFGTDPDAQKVEMLKNIPIFQELTRKEILEVDELLHERVYEKGEIVFEEGDAGHGIFIIVSGKVRTDSSHKLLKMANLEFGPGELLGELSLFDEALRPATVVAIERTVALALFQAEFTSLLTTDRKIGVKVLVEIARIISRRTWQLLFQEKHLPSI